MKNMLKKIGVIGIIIAMLAPFFEMPVVKAAETQTCSDHTLQQYFFLDVFNGGEIKEYIDGRTTAAMFANLFPNIDSGKKINIINVSLEELESKKSLTDYWSEMTYLGGDYSYEKKSSIGKVGSYQTTSANSIEYYSSILHGYWGLCETSDCDSTKLKKEAGWYEGNASDFYKSSIQNLLDNTNYKLEDDNNIIVGARFSSNQKLSGVNSNKYSDLKSYFTAVSNRTDNDLISTYANNEYLGLQITREILDSQYKNLTYGTDCSLSDANCSEKNGYNGEKYVKFDSANDFFDNNSNYTFVNERPDVLGSDTFYWPVILNVEYEVCTNTSEEWTLKYDGNTDDDSVTNIPNSQKKTVGTYITVDEKTPTRDGYVFKGWNTEKNGSGKSYTGGEKFESPDSADVKILFAQWGDASEGDQKKTGVVSYVIGFISVGIVASGIYLIAKKKNLFRQI